MHYTTQINLNKNLSTVQSSYISYIANNIRNNLPILKNQADHFDGGIVQKDDIFDHACAMNANPTLDVDIVVDSTDLASSDNFKSRVDSVPSILLVSSEIVYKFWSCCSNSFGLHDADVSPNIWLTSSSNKVPGINKDDPSPIISSSLLLLNMFCSRCQLIRYRCH